MLANIDSKGNIEDKVYVVVGDTYLMDYSFNATLFGIFSNKEDAEKAKEIKEQEYFEKMVDDEWSYVGERDDVQYRVIEIDFNKIIDVSLGGYTE